MDTEDRSTSQLGPLSAAERELVGSYRRCVPQRQLAILRFAGKLCSINNASVLGRRAPSNILPFRRRWDD